MTRLAILRVAWTVCLVAIASIALFAWQASGRQPGLLVVMVVLLLLPGRIQGYFLRDLFTGRRLMDRHLHREALRPLSAFVEIAKARPVYRMLLWLGWPGYSTSPLAMALNNRGACYLALGELGAAESDLRSAIEEDPHSPLPFVNLGLVHAARGEDAVSKQALERAQALGFRGGLLDTIQTRASGALAKLEGKKNAWWRPTAAPAPVSDGP